MNRRVSLPAAVVSLLLGANACAGPISTTVSGPAPAPADEVFACLRKELKSVGFEQSSYDVTERRLGARRHDETVRRPDVQFRRLVDRLFIQVSPNADTTGSTISVDARTYAERGGHRGPTEEQERTSERAKEAAQALIARCSTPAPAPAS